jgi:hypothetical protein
MAEVLGIEDVASESTLSRFLNSFEEGASHALNRLHQWAMGRLPSLREGYTLDLDSRSLLHRDGHPAGVRSGHTPIGLKPCHRSLIACLAEPKLVAGFWLRPGNAQRTDQAPEFISQLLEQRRLDYVVVMRLYVKWQKYCRHADAAWMATEIEGWEVQEIDGTVLGRRVVIMRQRLSQRPEAGGKELLSVPGYRFQALATNLPASWSALAIWRRYNGRSDGEGSGNWAASLASKDFAAKGVGAVGKNRIANLALAFVLSCGHMESRPRQTHLKTRSPWPGTKTLVDKTHWKTQ